MIITKQIQWRQEEHDKYFHHDIYCLNKPDRLKHLIFHMAKYQGKYLEQQAVGNQVKKREVVIDAIIVLTSMANVLGYAIKGSAELSPGFSYNEIVIETGRLCKVIEAWDHMEAIDFKTEFQRHLENLLRLWTTLPIDRDIRWDDVLGRLEFVESKNFMFQHVIEEHPHLAPKIDPEKL